VAESKSALQQAGLTRGKAVLIAVLAVVLAGVVYLQYGRSGPGESDPPQSSSRPPLPARTPRGTPLAAAVVEEQGEARLDIAMAEFDEARWQPPELAEVIAYDPFALPPEFPQPPRAVLDPELAAGGDDSTAAVNAQQLADAVEQMQQRLAELQQRGVHVIVNVRDEYVAMIGDRTIRVGDEINGFIVTAIEPDGVRVERKAVE
jgi:hypothetical protein